MNQKYGKKTTHTCSATRYLRTVDRPSISTYFRQHWRGQQPLKQTIVLNTIVPLLLYLLLQRFLIEPLIECRDELRLALLLIIAVAYGLTIITSAVSVNRKSRIPAAVSYSAGYHLMACNSILLMAACFALFRLFDINTHGIKTPTTIKQAFSTITLSADSHVAGRHYLTGELTSSSPRLFQTYISNQPQATELVLDSTGGNICAARAIANTIIGRGLNTHVEQQCYSACTLVFASGKQRSAGTSARFGFHGYAYQSANPVLYGKIEDHQKKDAAFFSARGINQAFIEQMFTAHPTELWQPSLESLTQASFIHVVY